MVRMEVPIGILSLLWSFISFVPIFFLLLVLGIIKAAIICPIVSILVFFGNSAVIIGLWFAHFFWTYYCLIKTKRIGPLLKIVLLTVLPVPLILWPVLGIPGNLVIGIGYGFFAPLIATFEAVGENVSDKLYHCFADGCRSTIEGACTFVRDFTDFCFHSYFSFMDDISEKVSEDEVPIDIKYEPSIPHFEIIIFKYRRLCADQFYFFIVNGRLLVLPSCIVVALLGVPFDVVMITLVAFTKSPYMLIKGWHRLFNDLVGREGPFLETVCVPFAALAILLWPLAVIGAVGAAFLSSFFLGLYGSIITYQEDSLLMGLAYIVSAISLFDEYSNDLLYLRDGSCLPRPKYRRNRVPMDNPDRVKQMDQSNKEPKNASSRLRTQRSKTLKNAIKQLMPFQIWDWLFRSCEINGRMLLSEGLINASDIEECLINGKSKKLSIKLPAWCILQCLIRSAKSDSYGLLISDEVELTNFNWPKDKVLEWFLGPLLVMKEQLKGLNLNEDEELCLKKLIMIGKNEKPEDWDEACFPSDDNVKRAQLQALIRRLQGIVASMSRYPTFRRRFNNLVKSLYLEAVETGLLTEADINLKIKVKTRKSAESSKGKQKKISRSTEGSSWQEVGVELV